MLTFKEFLAEGPASPFLKSAPQVKAARGYIKKVKGGKAEERMNAEMALEKMYDELMPKFKKILTKFQRIVKSNFPKGDVQKIKFFSMIKPLKSLKDKIIDRNTPPESIGDIVRGAVLFEKQADVEKFVKDFRRKNKSLVIGYEMKKKGQDKELGYYGSHHLDLMVDGLVTELQVMTRKMWKYKEAAHVLYTNNRTDISQGKGVSSTDSALSKKLYSLAQKPKFQREGFDAIFDALMESITEEEMATLFVA